MKTGRQQSSAQGTRSGDASPRVLLLGNIACSQSFSMHVYGQELAAALQRLGVACTLLEPAIGGVGRWARLKGVYSDYPRIVRRVVKEGLSGKTYDLYHVIDQSYAHLCRSLPPERTVVTCHDLIPFTYRPSTSTAARVPYRWSVTGMRSASSIIAVSTSTAKDVVRLLGIAERRIRVVPHAVHPVPISRGAALARRKALGLGPRDIAILVVGIAPYKNVLGALKAFTAVSAAAPAGVGLVLLKVGAFTTEERAYIGREGIGNRIHEYVHITDAELRLLYASSDILLFPSFYEGFGLPPLEAMAAGCAVLCSGLASLPEVVGDAALLCNPYDQTSVDAALKMLVQDPQLRGRLVTKAQQRVRQFTWERTARQTLAVYKKILENTKYSKVLGERR